MSNEPEASSSGGHELPAVPPEGKKKPKRRIRKPAGLKPQELPTTVAGEEIADQLHRKLIEMVNAAALTEANRRRATAIDATDYEAGFDRITGPAKRAKAVAIVADIAGAVGTGLIGYAINIYTSTSSDMPRGHLALIGGAALVIASVVLKYVIDIK